MLTRSAFRPAFLLLVILLVSLACNLPGGAATPAPAPTLSGFAVEITSPAASAQVPQGTPLQVTFTASGGPLIEVDLSVDDLRDASMTRGGSDVQVSGTLQWDSATAGGHILRVTILDSAKNTASSEVQVQVGQGAEPAGSTPTVETASTGGMQVRFVNLVDGGTIIATVDKDGRLVVLVQVEVSGVASFLVDMSEIDLPVRGEARNPGAELPFHAELPWYPLNGGGSYTLVATALNDNKQTAQAIAHVTVTGIPVFTATPPPLDQAAARKRFTDLYQKLYGINIPMPSMQRFDFPKYPNFSRWISSIYYRSQRYYIDLYDDTHYELNQLPYADSSHPSQAGGFVLCRPAGDYKALVVYVDYGNLGLKKEDVLAQVPLMVDWTNNLYDDYAKSQGFASSPLHIQADTVYLPTPPSPGKPPTAAQILSATGVDPAKYNFVVEIDLDKENTVNRVSWNGAMEAGGGLAFGGCGKHEKFDINIWYVQMDARDTQGVLAMDFNHELSYLFGMLDNWAFSPSALTLPDGSQHDDWITYVMFGWSDSDGDGIPEIIDPTPYGTSGP